MILTKKQISEIERWHKKAKKAQSDLSIATQGIAISIQDFTGVDGECDLLQGDGFGFTPLSNNDTHIPIDHFIQHAKNKIDITADFINSNRSI